jgi:pimeloyl-ACP methyl ester carboxylesterase
MIVAGSSAAVALAAVVLIVWLAVIRPPSPSPTPGAAPPVAERPSKAGTLPALAWVDCWFGKDAARPERCAHLAVAERRGDPKSPAIQLSAVVFPGPQGGEMPVVMIAGGPGEPAGLDADAIGRWRTRIAASAWMRARDVVIFDIRGAGLSQPDLRCKEVSDAGLRVFTSAAAGQEAKQWQAAAAACRLTAAGIDLDSYTTRAIAADLRDLVTALDYPRYALLGISFGTRVVLTFLAQDPGKAAAVILDSVYPPDVPAYVEGAANAQAAFAQMFADCERDATCRAAFPNLAAAFRRVVAKAQAKPLEVTLKAAAGQPAQKIRVDDGRLIEMLFYGFYAWSDLAEIPATIAALDRGDLTAFVPVVERARDFYRWDNSSYGLFLAVECHDEFPFNTAEALTRAVASTPQFKGFALGNLALQACPGWGAPAAGTRTTMTTKPHVPALLLSGGLDPITPPRWAQAVAAQWPEAHTVVFPGVGHGVLRNHACADVLIGRFLTAPSIQPFDPCVLAIAKPPFKYPAARPRAR